MSLRSPISLRNFVKESTAPLSWATFAYAPTKYPVRPACFYHKAHGSGPDQFEEPGEAHDP